jgi:hypothetical protein
LGSGLGSSFSFVDDLEVYDGELYAVGSFAGPSFFIARWNGVSWLPVDGGLSFTGLALTTFEDDLIVGGEFSFAAP